MVGLPSPWTGYGGLAFALDGLRRVGLRPESRQLFGLPSPVTGYGGGGLVEVNGIEPSTSCLQSRRSPN
jgi:hypothetical protein